MAFLRGLLVIAQAPFALPTRFIRHPCRIGRKERPVQGAGAMPQLFSFTGSLYQGSNRNNLLKQQFPTELLRCFLKIKYVLIRAKN